VRLAIPAGDEQQRELGALAQLGLDVEIVPVADVRAALGDPRAGIDLASFTTSLDYPDPASFLAQMLGSDVSSSWLPRGTVRAVARLGTLWSDARDRPALLLARRVQREAVVLPYGTQYLGAVAGPRLGCRLWNGVESGLDLAALCAAGPH
jgi:hypothetical protein